MTSIANRVIDWRSQLSALDPYLKGMGGVIHVRLGSDSPGSAFAKALRFTMIDGEWPFPWTSVQIDREDPSTHYVSDIIQQIRRTVGFPVEAPRQVPPITINLGQDIKARGNVDIHDIEISTAVGPTSNQISERDVERFCDALKQELARRRVALLFMNTHEYSRAELVRLRRTLWDGALDTLLDHGLLVFDFSNPTQMRDAAIWPPDPSLAIDLLDKYDATSRAAAYDDLAQIAFECELVSTLEAAGGFAEAILLTSQSIRDMYARLAMCLIAPKVSNES